MTGDAYRYEPLARKEWKAAALARGRPEWAAEAGLSSYDAIRAGELDVVSDDYRSLTGREPLTIAELVARQRSEMPLAARRHA